MRFKINDQGNAEAVGEILDDVKARAKKHGIDANSIEDAIKFALNELTKELNFAMRNALSDVGAGAVSDSNKRALKMASVRQAVGEILFNLMKDAVTGSDVMDTVIIVETIRQDLNILMDRVIDKMNGEMRAKHEGYIKDCNKFLRGSVMREAVRNDRMAAQGMVDSGHDCGKCVHVPQCKMFGLMYSYFDLMATK